MFEEWLIDHESACNIGNWQWLSCTAFYAQYYRCYSPIAFAKKTDAKGEFVRKFVPELAGLPDKYIYEPWKAPIQDQKKAGCLVKGTGMERETDGMKAYPKPMFDFNERRAFCIDAMKKAYEVGLYGDDPKVLDGSWTDLFDEDPGVSKSAQSKQGNGTANAKQPAEKQKQDLGTDEEEGGAADVGGDTKSGDRGGNKRKRGGKGTLDAFVDGGRKTRRIK